MNIWVTQISWTLCLVLLIGRFLVEWMNHSKWSQIMEDATAEKKIHMLLIKWPAMWMLMWHIRDETRVTWCRCWLGWHRRLWPVFSSVSVTLYTESWKNFVHGASEVVTFPAYLDILRDHWDMVMALLRIWLFSFAFPGLSEALSAIFSRWMTISRPPSPNY